MSHSAGNAHGHGFAPGERWRSFTGSPYYATIVMVLLIAAGAGLFAGSYTYALANPTPHEIPVTLVTEQDPGDEAGRFVGALERELDSSLEVTRYGRYEPALADIEAQRSYAVVRAVDGQPIRLELSSASGASVAQLLTSAGPKAGEDLGIEVQIVDLKPLDPGDPRGLALFYNSLAVVIIGFVGAIQLSVHARTLTPLERIAATAAYALLGGFSIAAVVDWVLEAIELPFVQSWMILSLTMFASGMVFTMFNTLFGRWAILPTWGLMVLLGNPSSGGAVSWPLLPSPLAAIGRWLPPGASVNAQHTAVYFRGEQHFHPYLVLTGWAVLSCVIFWAWRHRHPGGSDTLWGRARPPATDVTR